MRDAWTWQLMLCVCLDCLAHEAKGIHLTPVRNVSCKNSFSAGADSAVAVPPMTRCSTAPRATAPSPRRRLCNADASGT